MSSLGYFKKMTIRFCFTDRDGRGKGWEKKKEKKGGRGVPVARG